MQDIKYQVNKYMLLTYVLSFVWARLYVQLPTLPPGPGGESIYAIMLAVLMLHRREFMNDSLT